MFDLKRISVDVANQVLATFGITEPTRKYDRWLKEDGFEPDDFHDILADSRFIFIIDWRAVLPDELTAIVDAITELGARLEIDVPQDANDGWISCAGKQARVKFVPSDDDDFTDVILAAQSVVPDAIEFRASTTNGLHDSWEFAVLLREEWSALDALDRQLIRSLYVPLPSRA